MRYRELVWKAVKDMEQAELIKTMVEDVRGLEVYIGEMLDKGYAVKAVTS